MSTYANTPPSRVTNAPATPEVPTLRLPPPVLLSATIALGLLHLETGDRCVNVDFGFYINCNLGEFWPPTRN
jgi:hypothetical protein